MVIKLDEKQKKKILSLINHENTLKRKKGIKLACKDLNEEFFEKIKLILQIDEKESVRKCALEQLMNVKSSDLNKKILAILIYVEKNEPNHELKSLAKKGIEKLEKI